jgi:hypothetical protein
MAYAGEISRDNPTCILFIIDQSGSMADRMTAGKFKAEFVSDALNKTLYTMITNCSKSDGIRDYFDVGVIAYGGHGISAGFSGSLSGPVFQPISALADHPLRVEDRTRFEDDGAGGVLERKIKFPVWFDPANSGGTPMRAALIRAAEALVQWCDTHPHSYPPTILHLTDGESTDGSPDHVSQSLRQISTDDGTCLLFNTHVSTQQGEAVRFPSDKNGLADSYAKLLFDMSSVLPGHVAQLALQKAYAIGDGARGFIFNADPKDIVNFFDIGTRPRLMVDR